MTDLNTYRIPVIPGINDVPLGPNFNNNGRGPNGAYFTKKYNDLIYALGFNNPIVTDFSISIPTTNYEVGTRIFNTPGSISFSYSMSNSGNMSFMDIYLDGIKQNNDSLLPGEPHLYAITDINTPPNMQTDAITQTWTLLGKDQLNDNIGPYTIHLKWLFRTIVGTSTHPDINSYTDPMFEIDMSQSVLYKPSTVSKTVTSTPRYIYIFLPRGKGLSNNGYTPYSSFRVNGFVAPFVLELRAITRFGVNITYDVYRLANPTSGQVTVQLS